jgi:Tfp pilus assembly protein FimT
VPYALLVKNAERAAAAVYPLSMMTCCASALAYANAATSRLRRERGFLLIEVLVSVVISTIVIGLSLSLFLSALTTQVRMQRLGALADEADFTKSWAIAKLIGADTPLHAADWRSVEFMASDGRCYLLKLDTVSDKLESRNASSCEAVADAAPFYLAGSLTNTASAPLFRYYDGQGNEIDIATQLSSAREVDIDYAANNGVVLKRTMRVVVGP